METILEEYVSAWGESFSYVFVTGITFEQFRHLHDTTHEMVLSSRSYSAYEMVDGQKSVRLYGKNCIQFASELQRILGDAGYPVQIWGRDKATRQYVLLA